MTQLMNVYITRRNFETLEAVIKILEQNGIETFVARSGRDTEVLVKNHNKGQADILTYDAIFEVG